MKSKNKSPHINLPDIILSLIIVVKNDQEILEERIIALDHELKQLKINYEIVILDNGSYDKTIVQLEKLQAKLKHIRIIILSRTYDTEIALTAGIDSCIGDYAIIFNIYTDPPEILEKIIRTLLEGYEIVIAKMKKEIISYSLLSLLFLKILQRLSHHHFEYRTNYLIGLDRKAINAITRTRRKSRNFSYLNDLIGLRKTTFFYTPLKRYAAKLKKNNFFELFFTVTDIVISNSYRPIRIIAFLGIIASGLFLLYAILITIIHFFFYQGIAPQGWISLAIVTGSLFFLLFSLLTLIAEYIIRTLHETRNDPLYFISDEIDTSVVLREQDKLNVV